MNDYDKRRLIRHLEDVVRIYDDLIKTGGTTREEVERSRAETLDTIARLSLRSNLKGGKDGNTQT